MTPDKCGSQGIEELGFDHFMAAFFILTADCCLSWLASYPLSLDRDCNKFQLEDVKTYVLERGNVDLPVWMANLGSGVLQRSWLCPETLQQQDLCLSESEIDGIVGPRLRAQATLYCPYIAEEDS